MPRWAHMLHRDRMRGKRVAYCVGAYAAMGRRIASSCMASNLVFLNIALSLSPYLSLSRPPSATKLDNPHWDPEEDLG